MALSSPSLNFAVATPFKLMLAKVTHYTMCMHAGKKLHQAKEATDNVKIMRPDDLRSTCYQYENCSGPSIQTPPGTDCCEFIGSPDIYQQRVSPAGPICCIW